MEPKTVLSEQIEALERYLLSVDRIGVENTIREAITENSPIETIEQIVVPALELIGQGWEAGQVSLAQVYMSGRLCEDMVDTFLPPNDPERTKQPAMAIAVFEDYHFLGLRIVYSVLRASGFELLNYRHMDLAPLVNRVKTDSIKILLISVLMLPSALRIKELRHVLSEEGCKAKLLVGGAPFRFDHTLWQEVGADAFGYNAGDAISEVNKLIEASQ